MKCEIIALMTSVTVPLVKKVFWHNQAKNDTLPTSVEDVWQKEDLRAIIQEFTKFITRKPLAESGPLILSRIFRSQDFDLNFLVEVFMEIFPLMESLFILLKNYIF